MNQFEKVWQIDPLREQDSEREIHKTIELSDQQYLDRLTPKVMQIPSIIGASTTETIKVYIEGKDEKNKSKSTSGKPSKVSRKSNKTTVARLQEKL